MIEEVQKTIYKFDCVNCHEKRQSMYKIKAVLGLCRKCKVIKVDKNQIVMFS